MGVLSECVVCAVALEARRVLNTLGQLDSCELLCECWGSNGSSLGKQTSFLADSYRTDYLRHLQGQGSAKYLFVLNIYLFLDKVLVCSPDRSGIPYVGWAVFKHLPLHPEYLTSSASLQA